MSYSQTLINPDYMEYEYETTTTADHLTTENALINEWTSAPLPYHGDSFWAFHNAFAPVHGYIALIICVFGIPFNLISIIVLTRHSMITPINIILTALAIVDMLVLITYVPFTVHQYILKAITPIAEWRSYAWMAFIHFNIHFTIICHTVTVWLTITVAVFRFLAVGFPHKAATYCSMGRAGAAIAAAWLSTVVLCIPSYLSTQVAVVDDEHLLHHMHSQGHNVTMYRIEESEFSSRNSHIPRKVSFWAFSALGKLLPCIVLACFSTLLVLTIKSDRSAVVPDPLSLSGTQDTSIEMTPFLGNNPGKSAVYYHGGRSDGRNRITPMIVAILIFFLITEFPSGILALISGCSIDFFANVYVPLGDLMDIAALLNSSVNFIIYVSFSWQFREALVKCK